MALSNANIVRVIAQEVARRQERGLPPPTSLPTVAAPIDPGSMVLPPSVPRSIDETAMRSMDISNQIEDVDIPTRPIDFRTDPEFQQILQAIEEQYRQPPPAPPKSIGRQLLENLPTALSIVFSRDPGG